jgi:hypothetical protein
MIKSIAGDMIQDDFRAGAANEITRRFYPLVTDKPEMFYNRFIISTLGVVSRQ